MPKKDPYYKKTVSYKHLDKTLQFNLSQSLFSSLNIDHGTQRLLRTMIFTKFNKYKKVLDLGCGAGPIGITLKSVYPEAEVHMIDRDALALRYSQANAKLNNLDKGIKVYGSLGYGSVTDTDFDLIVSNVPAKVGQAALTHLINSAKNHLIKEGRVVIVVIDEINIFVEDILSSNENIEILYQKSWPGHHVYHYKFISNEIPNHKIGDKNEDKDGENNKTAFEKGQFYKQENSFEYNGREIILKTSHNLPEFDQLSFDTKRTLRYLKKIKDNPTSFLVFNPGQGYLPLALTRQFKVEHITLVDRDLLALKTTKENLLRYDYPEELITTKHQVGLEINNKDETKKIDIIIGTIPEKQNIEVYTMYLEQIENTLNKDGQALLSSSSTVITRIEDIVSKINSFNVVYRERHKGRSLLLLKKVK